MNKLTQIATEWIGTPWLHNQAVKGKGADCVGFLIGVGKEAGVISKSFTVENYHRIPRFNQIIKTLDSIENLQRVDSIKIGDILVIKFGNISCHVVMYYDEDRIIHSDDIYGVHITSFNFFKDKVSVIYRVKQ
jgi:hypothetical protein